MADTANPYCQSKLPYDKPWTSYQLQKELLVERGLSDIEDNSKWAENWLSHIGYARLSRYFIPFLKEDKKNFHDGASFRHIIELYSFDRKLKILILDAISKVEISLRANVAYILGENHPIIQNQDTAKNIFIPNFMENGYEEWIKKIKKTYDRENDSFSKSSNVEENSSNDTSTWIVNPIEYTFDSLPIWLLVELWDFGCLVKCIKKLNLKFQTKLSGRYEIDNRDTKAIVESLYGLNYLRNICSHHDMLWCKILPKKRKINKNSLTHADNNRLYSYLAILRFLLKIIDKESKWHLRLKERIKKFPVNKFISLKEMGFSETWWEYSLWQ